jgi:dienelactone hydrolase
MSSPEANKPLIDAVSELGDRGIVEIFDGADHGFAVPGMSYHEEAAGRSYEQALDLFRKTLTQGVQR